MILIKIPIEAKNYSINNAGCIKYELEGGRKIVAITPDVIGTYLTKEQHQIIGEINEGKIKTQPILNRPQTSKIKKLLKDKTSRFLIIQCQC